MKCFPHRQRVFFLSNLLQREPSCSLVKFCSTDSPTDPALSSCQVQSTHTDRPWSTKPWPPKHEVKKENNPSLSLPPIQPLWNGTAPDKADKVAWSATSDGQWSTQCCGEGVYTHWSKSTIQLQLAKQIIELLVTWIYTVDKQWGNVCHVLSSF